MKGRRAFGHDSDEFYIRLCLLCGASHRGCSSCVTQRKAGVNTAVQVNWLPSVHKEVHAARDEYREGEVAEFVSRSDSSQRACLCTRSVNVKQLVLLDVVVEWRESGINEVDC